MPRTCVIELPHSKPRLSPNLRLSRWERSRVTAEVRRDTGWLVKAAKLRPVLPIDVTLHYRPARNGRRDPGNLCLDSKACVDGIVDAGVAPDDTYDYIHEQMPVIHPAEKGEPGRMWIEISWEAA